MPSHTEQLRADVVVRDDLWEDYLVKQGTPAVIGCQQTTAKGYPCKSMAVSGYTACYFHLPGSASAAATAGCQSTLRYQKTLKEKGLAIARGDLPFPEESPDIELESVEDVKNVVVSTMNGVRRGHVNIQQAQMIAYLANTWIAADRASRASGPGAGDRQVPEWSVVERSDDPRATSKEFPGSDYGAGGDEIEEKKA